MRILLLNYEYPPLGGGAGVATQALARGLVARGTSVDVVTARSEPGRRGPLVEQSQVDGIRLYRVRTRRKGVHHAGMAGAGGYLLGALPTIRRLARRGRYDLVHIFFSLPTGALLPVAGLTGVPVIVSLRGSDVPGYDRSNPRLQRMHRLLRPLTRWIWRRADRVSVVCESLGRLAQETLPGLRFEVVPNGVDLDLFRPPAVPRPERTEGLVGLAVARLIERKGLANLLRAWRLLERGRQVLEIAGGGPDRGRLEALARELGIAGEVRFTGPLDRAALAERYRAADFFVLTPSDEAFGNVFAEALAAGLPIVGSGIGGIPDLVEDGENGFLVAPEDPASIVGAVGRLVADPALRRRMAERNRARAESSLSWEHVTGTYLDLYARVIGRPPVVIAPETGPVVPV